MTELSQHPLAGVAPAMSAGLNPDDVAARLVQGILNDEKDLPAESFVA
jgi:cyclic-di-GMP-binding biofilm dispersal mediator protein